MAKKSTGKKLKTTTGIELSLAESTLAKLAQSLKPTGLGKADEDRIKREIFPLLRFINSPGPEQLEQASLFIKKKFEKTVPKLSRLDHAQFLLACNLSGSRLHGYSTLDKDHVAEIDRLVVKISAYVKDSSQKRPLVFMMSASPGSGKSHFIKCIGRRIKTDRVEAVNYNMASMMSPEDLIPALDAARNHKVEDNVPLLFLDEFDSEPGNIPMLLPLLWDGEITIGQRNLKLGKMIIVLAGSDPALPEAMKAAASMDVDSKSPLIIAQPKYTDLFSRINGGVFSIPVFQDKAKDIDRRTDKICIAVELLKHRFGKTLLSV